MNKAFQIIILLLIVTCWGCAPKQVNVSPDLTSSLNLYQLYIDANGNLLNPNNKVIITNESKYLDAIFESIAKEKKQNPNLQLTVFIHGGLNSFESATSRVAKIKDEMLQNSQYPLFISWNSGAFTNYFDHLFMIREGVKSPLLGPLSSPFVLAEDTLRSIARFPASTYNVVFGQNSVRINARSQEEVAAQKALTQLENQGFKIYNSPNDTGHNFGDWWSIWNPTKIITAPFIDGLGKGSWDSMLRRTDLVLRKDIGFNGTTEINSETAVTTFFNRYTSNSNNTDVNIIGHSMGTIIANNIIARYQDINFTSILYMAAACKTKDLEYVIAPYLERNTDTTFYSLSLNSYRDISENYLYDFIPRGSLLIWIDQTLGDTNSFQDRTAGYWFNIVRGASETFKNENVRKRVHLTQFGIKDGTPQVHGDFSNFNFWQETFWKGQI